MHKALAALLLLLAAALAMPIDISFNYGNSSYFYQGSSYTVTVTVKNLANVTDTIDVDLDTGGVYARINNSAAYHYNITNLTAGSSSAASVTLTINESTPFGEEDYFRATAEDSNGTSNESRFDVRIPDFTGITASMNYTPANAYAGVLKVEGRLSDANNHTHRFNTTYSVKKASNGVACLTGNHTGSSTLTTTEISLNLTNCTSAVYNVEVSGTADGLTRSASINSIYLFGNVTFTAEFFRIEDFGYERPFAEVERLIGNDSMAIRGVAKYSDGTVLSFPPDDPSSHIELKIVNSNSTNVYNATRTPNSDGTYSFLFPAPSNTSKYTATLNALGKSGYNTTITYTFTVNNTRDYKPEPLNATEILANTGISAGGTAFTFSGGELVLNITVSNNNFVTLTGKPMLQDTTQFTAASPPTDMIFSKQNESYLLTVKPRDYTKPGTYTLPIAYDTYYGRKSLQLQVTVPNPEPESQKMNVYRFIEYKSNSPVTLRLVNRLGYDANVILRENISKSIIASLGGVQTSLTACGADVPCKYWAVLANGSCSDCSLLGEARQSNCTAEQLNSTNYTCTSSDGNYTALCKSNCTNRTAMTFSPPYTRVISDDPVVEWDVFVRNGETAEVMYYTAKLVAESWFTEPLFTTALVATPTPTPVPTPEPTPEPTPSPTPQPPGVVSGILVALGVIFGLVVVVAIAVSVLFIKKKDEVAAFVEKYLPVELPKTSEDIERERIKKIFVTEEQAKAAEAAPLAKPVKKEGPSPIESFLKKLNEMFMPVPRAHGPESLPSKPAEPLSKTAEKKPEEKKKDEQFKDLKDIGKGFGEQA